MLAQCLKVVVILSIFAISAVRTNFDESSQFDQDCVLHCVRPATGRSRRCPMSSSPTGQSRIKLATLHKGMGIRRDNLHDFLGEWPARWHLHTEDDATVRAHLACWVNETLDDLASSQHRTVGRVAYNTAWDMDLRDMMYEARLRRLQE